MHKNVAGQKIGAQMVSATDGSAFTGSVTVAVTGDAGTQATGSVGSGACTHEGNGYHTYAPAQAETNYDLVAFTFTGSGAVPATVQVFTGTIPTAVENADALLARNVSNVEASAAEHTLCTVILAQMESSMSGSTWTIKRTNGSTTHATKTVTTDAAANPITGVS